MRVVLTGAPASGKTTIINYLKDKFKGILIPEVATILISEAGMYPPKKKEAFAKWLINFQIAVSRTQATWENFHYANEDRGTSGEKVIIQDRGLYDNGAYIMRAKDIMPLLYRQTGNPLYKPLENMNHAIARILKLSGDFHYYDKVFILKTTGHEPELYEEARKNNPARYETSEEAVMLENLIQEAYTTAHQMGLVGEVVYVDSLEIDTKIKTIEQHI